MEREQSSQEIDRHAKVRVIAPDGSVVDSVKVRFDHEQPIGIDPLEWTEKGYFGNEYKLELVYLHADGDHYTKDGLHTPESGRND